MMTNETRSAYRPQPWGRPTLRNAAKPRLKKPDPRPVLTPGTLTWVGDRSGTARLDAGGSVDVRLPDVLWLRTGDRVLMYQYPDGWVAVLRVAIGPALDHRDPDRRSHR